MDEETLALDVSKENKICGGSVPNEAAQRATAAEAEQILCEVESADVLNEFLNTL